MYMQPKAAKKVIAFELPTTQNVEPAITSVDTPGLSDVQIEYKPDLKSRFKALHKKEQLG
jgi:hypothetical protein